MWLYIYQCFNKRDTESNYIGAERKTYSPYTNDTNNYVVHSLIPGETYSPYTNDTNNYVVHSLIPGEP